MIRVGAGRGRSLRSATEKTLKFRADLIPKILSGEKTTTWRLFDDKNLSVGDVLQFVNKDTKGVFTKAEITKIREKKLGDVVESDFEGHEQYKSWEVMLKHYREYYGDKVNLDTMVKMIEFRLLI